MSRAPLVTLHQYNASLLDTSKVDNDTGTAPSSSGSAEEQEVVVMQGPDGRPPNFTPSQVVEEKEIELLQPGNCFGNNYYFCPKLMKRECVF